MSPKKSSSQTEFLNRVTLASCIRMVLPAQEIAWLVVGPLLSAAWKKWEPDSLVKAALRPHWSLAPTGARIPELTMNPSSHMSVEFVGKDSHTLPGSSECIPLLPLRVRVNLDSTRSHEKTHSPREYRCELCGQEFTRRSSEKRHKDSPTACKGAQRASSTSTLGSSSGGLPRSPPNAHDGIPLGDSSTGPVPGNRLPLALGSYLSSPTNSQTTNGHSYSPRAVRVHSQPQGVAATQSPPSPTLARSSTDPAGRNWQQSVSGLYPSPPNKPPGTSESSFSLLADYGPQS